VAAEAPALTEDAADAAGAAAPGANWVWLLGKRELMQPSTQLAYAVAAGAEPSPWSHFAAQLLVSMTWDALGRALPKQAAWHMTSPASQFKAQLTAGESPEGMGAPGADVIEAWGTAKAPAARARMAVVYFIVMVGLVICGTARCVKKWVYGLNRYRFC